MRHASPEKLTELLEHCLGFAGLMLEDAGEFYPFGGVIGADGKVGAVGGSDGTEKPSPREIYQLLFDGFEQGAASGKYVATALAANVDVPKEFNSPYPDAIRVHIEADGYARYVYLPYAVKVSGFFKKKRELVKAELFAVEIPPAIFKPRPGT